MPSMAFCALYSNCSKNTQANTLVRPCRLFLIATLLAVGALISDPLFSCTHWILPLAVVCMDGEKSFRKELTPTYKANRKETPDDLRKQFPIVEEAVRALGIACVRLTGFEADDLLATYSKKASDAGHEVLVVSPDKDMLQLVSDSVGVTSATGAKYTVMDASDVAKKFGVSPEQVPHLQALIGDAVDNIPKVSGLTEAAAKNLIKHFGTVHNALENINDITVMSQRDALRLHAETIKSSYELAKLRQDAPVGELQEAAFKGITPQTALAFCSKYKLKSISVSLEKDFFAKYRAAAAADPSAPVAPAKKTTLITEGKEPIDEHGFIKKTPGRPKKTASASATDAEHAVFEDPAEMPPMPAGSTLETPELTIKRSKPVASFALARGAKSRLLRLAEEANRTPSSMSYEQAVAIEEEQYANDALEMIDILNAQNPPATPPPAAPVKVTAAAKKAAAKPTASTTSPSAPTSAADAVTQGESSPVAPPPIPRARRKRTSSTEALSTDGHVSEEIDIDTDPTVVASTTKYKETRKKKEKPAPAAAPITPAAESDVPSTSSTSSTAESSTLDIKGTEQPIEPVATSEAPSTTSSAPSSSDAATTSTSSKHTTTAAAPILSSTQTSHYHTSAAAAAKKVDDDAVKAFVEALKKTSANPDAIDAALKHSASTAKTASPGSLFSPATRQPKMVASLSTPPSEAPTNLTVADLGQIDGLTAEPKKRTRKPKIVDIEDSPQIGVFPASKLASTASSIGEVTPAANSAAAATKRKNPVNGPGSRPAGSSAPKYSGSMEPEEDDEESNLELVDYIKNRTHEVDVEFVNIFNICNTPIERRRAIESKLKGVTVANDAESAKRVIDKLMTLTDRFHACDSETINLNLKKQGPVGHGTIICASIYCGPDIDFGNGPRVWIDNLDDDSTLQLFKDYFESEKILKVWHNYGFDRHVFYNHGINVQGFGGDTMHMGRLWDSSRRGAKAYSLEVLSRDLLLSDSEKDAAVVAKTSMKQRFGRVKLKKDGTPSKSAIILPDLAEIQRDPEWLPEWVDYATLDAEDTWRLREVLAARLTAMNWVGKQTMYDFYRQLWLPFGELLTDMERRGIKVDRQYLRDLVPRALEEKAAGEAAFVDWAVANVGPECRFINPGSDAQKQQLLFAPCNNKLDPSKEMPASREFEAENTEGFIEEGKKVAKKKRTFTITGLGLPFVDATDSGWPAVSHPVLAKLVGDPPEKYGSLVKLFDEKGMRGGKQACEALAHAVESSKIDTLINTFMIPLAEFADSNSRIHGSLNINTETGRLSSRRPNLQNQPAHEKDRFKIRRAFTCEPGNNLIVADYGQLELRLLAHMTNCKSMLDAFRAGGDFHSRTALGMYGHVKQAIDDGKVLLEWDYSKGKAPLPLLKDEFGTERRRAKTLNFSIAYGKTVMGLAKDWSVSPDEARSTLDKWYADRPEVKQWQEKTIARAHVTGWTRTLLGRYRPLPEINSRDRTRRTHSERAAINTPLQGGAADITTKAMILLHQNERLRQLGWHQLLQIHDELILEGPEESTEEALSIVTNVMSNPLPEPLLVDLVVDAKAAKTWYEAK